MAATTEKESSIIVSLPHMVDLALGSPEVGAVNFNVLHSLLHVMIQQMNLRKTQVEFRGPDCDRIRAILQTAPPSPTLKLSEYTIAPEESKANLAKPASRDRRPTSSKKPADVKKEVKKDTKKAEDEGSVVLVQQSEDGTKSKVVEREVDKQKPIKRVSKDELNKVEEKVSQLEKQVTELQSLPSNEELINRSRSTSQTTPVNDMWMIMNLTKRMDAAEDCMGKLTSMVEDLAKDTAGGGVKVEAVKPGGTKAPGLFERLDTLETRVSSLEGGTAMPTAVAGTPGKAAAPATTGGAAVSKAPPAKPASGTTDQVIVAIRNELTQVRKDVDNIGSQIQQVTAVTEKIPFDTFMAGIKGIDELRARFGEFAGLMKQKAASSTAEQEAEQQNRLNELEVKLNECTGQMEGMDTTITNQMDTLQQQLSEMERELGEVLEKVNTGTGMGESFSQDFTGLGELYNKIKVIQGDMENLNQTATRLMDDREERQLHIEALLEQIESLKTAKADREDLEEALADKADQNTVNRKVSHDQFDAACDDLSRGLEDALAKLTQQETIWQQALDDIQREIENKLDKIEISPLKDFVNSKLKVLQERLRVIANMRKESEAAGTKLKLLRNVNCISCDKDVVMKTQLDTPSIPAPDPMPGTRSMRPYLTYELDQVRRQQRRPPGKNLVTMEEMEREQARGGPYKEAKSVDHICNRYCGGSHTVTTPQQRVTRIGHFLRQWGPEAVQLTEGTVRGTDGNMYRAREMPPGSPLGSKRTSKIDIATAQKSSSVIDKKLSITERKVSSTSSIPGKKKSSLTTPSLTEQKSSSRVKLKSRSTLSTPGTKGSAEEVIKPAGSAAEISPGSPDKKPSGEVEIAGEIQIPEETEGQPEAESPSKKPSTEETPAPEEGEKIESPETKGSQEEVPVASSAQEVSQPSGSPARTPSQEEAPPVGSPERKASGEVPAESPEQEATEEAPTEPPEPEAVQEEAPTEESVPTEEAEPTEET